MYKKNDIVNLTIEDMSVNGEGIGHIDGFAFFVKGAVVGDEVTAGVTKLKKNMCYARIIDIIKPSAYRSRERCSKAKPCGGCQLQALNYDKQLELKEKHVRDNLVRIGGFDKKLIDDIIKPVVGMDEPFYYRNKLQVPVGIDKNGGVVMGFYLSHSHDIVPIESCALSHPKIDALLPVIRDWIVREGVSIYHNSGASCGSEGILRHILIRYAEATGETMVCLIGNVKLSEGSDMTANNPAHKFRRQLHNLADILKDIDGMTSIVFNENCKNTNVILGDKTHLIWGRDTIRDYIGDVAFNISCNSFYQVNPQQTKKMYDKVKEYAKPTGEEVVWDLYCGIGTIGLYLSKYAKSVFGVEVVEQAINDANVNAKINGITNAKFAVGKVEDVVEGIITHPLFSESDATSANIATVQKPDVIVLDPPRRGCDERCLEAILKLNPKKIIYVSCNPSTLARDLKLLCGVWADNSNSDDRRDRWGNYNLTALTPIDMFPQTGHIEVISCLSNQNE